MKFIPTLAFLGLGAAGIGGWYKFHNLTPKTLKEYLEWQGLDLISSSNDNYWRAVLADSEDVAKKAVNKISPTFTDVRDWCISNLNKEDYDEIKSWASLLCVDKPKTVKARIIQLDGNADQLIKDDDKYKVAYVFRKHISGFHDLIGYKPEVDKDGKEIENLEDAKKAFEKWCTTSLGKSVDETLVLNIRTLCTPKRFSSIEELIEQQGEKSLLLTDSNNLSLLKQKYGIIKNLASWTAEGKSEKIEEENLKDWCTENQIKKFSEEKVFSEIYPKFRYRCIKQTTDQNPV